MDPTHSHGPDRIDYRENPEDLSEIHAAILRENPEPSAAVTPIPLWLITICGIAVAWAGAYLGMFNGGFRGDIFDEYKSSPALVFAPPTGAHGAAAAPAAELSLADQGKAVYSNCVPCHQATGVGAPGQFPPLAGSPFVQGGEKRMIAIILKGVTGSFKVGDAQFNGQMPPWEAALTDKKIAAVASYVRSSFGNHAPEITPAQVTAARKEFADRKTSWSEADLLQIPADATLPGGGAAPAAPEGAKPGAPAAASAAAAIAPTAPSSPTAPAIVTPGAPAAGGDQMAAGKTIYMTICIACHQPTGAGIPPVFPPLTNSEYVNGPADRFAAMILKGNLPPFTLNGVLYAASPMPGQEAVLDDAKIAAVMTFVRANFGNNSPAVSPDVVAAVRKKFADRKTSWTQPELAAWGSAAAPAAP